MPSLFVTRSQTCGMNLSDWEQEVSSHKHNRNRQLPGPRLASCSSSSRVKPNQRAVWACWAQLGRGWQQTRAAAV